MILKYFLLKRTNELMLKVSDFIKLNGLFIFDFDLLKDVCGGFDGTSRHSTMEFYDPTCDKWTLLDSTSVGREGTAKYDKNK
jgi:hypothetical protein